MSEQFPEQDGDAADGPTPPNAGGNSGGGSGGGSEDNSEGGGEGDSGQFTQQVRPQQVTARVPESVGRGVFSTGALIQQGNNEFVLDFLVTVTRPHQIVARVVMPPGVVVSMMQAMRQNIQKYTERWGPPPTLPKPAQPVQPPPIEEIYANLKIPDDVLSGSYANALMISHSPSEFVFDFITGFYPKSSVSCRVFMSAAQGPRLLDSLTRSWQQYQRKIAAKRLEMGLPPIDEQHGFNSPGLNPPPPPPDPNDPASDSPDNPRDTDA